MPETFGYIKGHPCTKGDIIIGNDVWIAQGVRILSGVTIGDGAVIAANACVSKDVGPYEIWGGVPAKRIKYRFERSIITRLKEMKWWDWDSERIIEAIPYLQSNNFEELEKMVSFYDIR